MESTYLKKRLATLATLKERSAQIDTEVGRAELRVTYSLRPGEEYAAMCGRYIGMITGAHWGIEAAQQSANHLEIIERGYERLVTIFESLDINLDEEAMTALETLGKPGYQYERHVLATAIDTAIRETQESERDNEKDATVESLLAVGFVIDDEDDSYVRGHEQVRINLVNGRECRYRWEYETSEPVQRIETGKSGEFSRLMNFVAVRQSVPACGVSPSGEPCGTEVNP